MKFKIIPWHLMIKTVPLRVGKGVRSTPARFLEGPRELKLDLKQILMSRNATQWNCRLAEVGTSFFEGLDLNFRWKIGPTRQDKFVRLRSFFRFGCVSGHEIFHGPGQKSRFSTNIIGFILFWIYISIVGFESKLLKLPQKDEMNNCWKVINKQH